MVLSPKSPQPEKYYPQSLPITNNEAEDNCNSDDESLLDQNKQICDNSSELLDKLSRNSDRSNERRKTKANKVSKPKIEFEFQNLSKFTNRFKIENESFLDFVSNYNQSKTFEVAYSEDKTAKSAKNHRVEDVCATFTRRGANKVSLNQLFEKYVERKCFDKEADYINFNDFLKIEFKTCISKCDNNFFYEANNLKNYEECKKKMQEVKTLYPSIIYDLYYYLCLYEFQDIKQVNERYYDIIRKQINKEDLIDDQEILEKRKQSKWKYDNDEFNKLVEDFNNTKVAVKRIDLDSIFNARK